MDKRNLEKLVMEERNEELKNMLQDSEPSKLIDNSGMTLLHLAAKHNKLELIKYLLSVGFDINAGNSDRNTPLSIALFFDQFEAIKILLQWNADIFAVNSHGESAIEILMREMVVLPADVVMCIAENYKRNNLDRETKAEIVAKARGIKLQYVVAVCDNLATALFLERNDDIGSYEFSDAVKFAMEREDYESVRTIFKMMPYDKLYHVFFDQFNRFFQAERSDDIKYAELFIKRALDWKIMDKGTVCIVMSEFEVRLTQLNKEHVERFLHADFDVYIREEFGFEMLTSLFGNSKVDAIELVRNRAFLVNGKGTLGYSALHVAARQGFKFESRFNWEKKVRFLLDIGADPNVKDNAGKALSYLCILLNRPALGTLLLQYGADIPLDIFDHPSRSRTYIENVVAQLAVDDARGLPIENLLRDKIMSEYSITFEKCLKQIEEFKRHEILDFVTLFTVLTVKSEELARRLRGEDCFSKLEDYCRKREIHDYYDSTLKFKLDRASKINIAKSNFSKIVSQKAGIVVGFDNLVIDTIFSYLTYYDILQLV